MLESFEMLAAIWTLIGLQAATLLGVLYHLGGRIDRIDSKIDGLAARLDARLDALTDALRDHVQRHAG